MAATPMPTPQNFATIVDKGTYPDWAVKQQIPAVIMQRRMRCTSPAIGCSYHEPDVTALKQLTIVNHLTTEIFIPVALIGLLLSNSLTALYDFTPSLDQPQDPGITGDPLLDAHPDLTFTLNTDGSREWRITYASGIILTKKTVYEIFSGILAPDGTRILGSNNTLTDGSGNQTLVRMEIVYSSGEKLVIVSPCLRYEFMDLNSDTTVDTHSEKFNEYGPYLGWKG